VRRIVTLRMPAGLVEAIAAEKSVGKGGNRRSDVGEIASHKGRMFCTPPIDGPPRRRIVSKIFGCLFLLAVLGSYTWGGNVIQVRRGQEILLTIRLDPPPTISGWVIFYLGPDPDAKANRCKVKVDGKAEPVTSSSVLVEPGGIISDLHPTIRIPDIDPPYDRMTCRWKVLDTLFQPTGLPASDLEVCGDTGFDVLPAKQALGRPRKVAIQVKLK